MKLRKESTTKDRSLKFEKKKKTEIGIDDLSCVHTSVRVNK
jgi:hypothetical protein